MKKEFPTLPYNVYLPLFRFFGMEESANLVKVSLDLPILSCQSNQILACSLLRRIGISQAPKGSERE